MASITFDTLKFVETPENAGVETEDQEAAYAAWMRSKVQEADDDPRPCVPHDAVMAKADTLVMDMKAQYPQKVSA